MDSTMLRGLADRPLSGLFKALPVQTGTVLTAGEVSEQRWNVLAGDLTLPAMVLKESALAHNIDLMSEYCRGRGLDVAPHGKTSMAPQLFARQLEAGAWAITAGNIAQCRVMREFGVQRILLANVLVDPAGLDWVVGELAAGTGVEFLFYVDSDIGLEMAEGAVARSGSAAQLDVLVELGYPGGRTGARSVADAVRLATRVHRAPGVRLAGIAGFEGLMPGPDLQAVVASGREYLGRIHDVVEAGLTQGLFDVAVPVVTAGGSSFFDLVADALGPSEFTGPVRTVLRSGCYVTHDHFMFHGTSPFGERISEHTIGHLRPAFELWATVWSRPEPDLAILGFGKRDAPYDYGLPVPLRSVARDSTSGRELGEGYTVTGLNDQHAFMTLPPTDLLAVGDRVVLGISHPCTVFDKWRYVPVVDDDMTVLGGVFTFF